jgi:hypothetical protein
MPLPSRLVLALPIADDARLAGFVEDCLAAKVELIAVAGPGARAVEDRIDRLIVRDGADPARFIVTSAHEAGLADARFFAENWATEAADPPQVVRL